jgi:hypothetical protein
VSDGAEQDFGSDDDEDHEDFDNEDEEEETSTALIIANTNKLNSKPIALSTN